MQSRRWRTLPLVGVLTDFGAHDFWMQPGIDLYCVPHPSISRTPLMRRATRTATRVVVTGVPLMPGFANPPAQSAARQALGLDGPDASPVVLVLGGGLGLGLGVLVEPLLRQLRAGTVVVMAGRNEAARTDLCTMARESGLRLRICGWTDCMHEYIAAADVVVGKSGGLTVAEVLACGRPLLVTKSLRGQETFNVQFLEREGVGRFVSPEGLAEQVSCWLSDPVHTQELQARAWRIGRRHGAAVVAAHALRLARRTGPRFTTSKVGA
jgi:UDP-N-acetylglucosamine:LPS N-acetylglucosamine transferase